MNLRATQWTNAMAQIEVLERQLTGLEVSAERAFKEAGSVMARLADNRREIDRIRQEMASYAQH